MTNNVYKFHVDGITCSSCTNIIENVIGDIEGIISVNANIDKSVTITIDPKHQFNPDIAAYLKGELNDIGYTAVHVVENQKQRQPKRSIKWNVIGHLLQGIMGIAAGGSLMACMVMGLTFSPLALTLIAASSVSLSLILGAESYYQAAIKFFKTGTLTMDSLFTVSTVTALAVSIAAIFVPWLPMMFDAPLMIFGFKHIGRAIEEISKNDLAKRVNFRDRAPNKVLRVNAEGKDTICETQELNPGDIILVKAGECIPTDAECIDDNGIVYQTILTGNMLPCEIKKGDAVKAGMVVANAKGYLKFKVQATEANSHLAKLDQALNDAQATKSDIENSASKMLHYFIPAVFVLSALFGLAAWYFLTPALAIYSATTVLVSACPCILGFVVPYAIKLGMTKAFSHGVQFKHGNDLQKAASINTVVLDLNGTLTQGRPHVGKAKFNPDKISKTEFIESLLILEQKSKHPVAKAITQYCKKRTDKTDAQLSDVKEIDNSHHSGIQGTIKGVKYTVGNLTMLKEFGVNIDKIKIPGQNHADHLIFMAKDGVIVGQLEVVDPLRPDAKSLVHALRAMGKDVHICTGASRHTALRYAAALDIKPEKVHADCSERANKNDNHQTKTQCIESLQKQGRKVAMVGDAGNDAIAMKVSDLGIAVQSASTDEVTQEHAGVVIRNASLQPVLTTFVVAQQTMNNIQQNLIFSTIYNLSVISIGGIVLVGQGLMINPAIGVVFMVAQSSLLLAHTYLLSYKSIPKLPPNLQRQNNTLSAGFGQDLSYSQLNKFEKQPSVKPQHDNVSNYGHKWQEISSCNDDSADNTLNKTAIAPKFGSK